MAEVFDASVTLSRVGSPDEGPMQAVTIVRDLSAEKRLSAMQNRFINHAAHELRQPIASINTRLYLLEKTPEGLDRHVEIIRQASERLTALSEHMALIAQFDMNEIRVERMRLVLQELLGPVIQNQQAQAEKRGISIEVDWKLPAAPIPVDNTLMTQLTHLLLSNAVVHSAEDSTINLSYEHVDDMIVIEMLDTRSPLPDDQLEQAFQPFYVPSAGSVVHTGLELTIINNIVTLLDGSISIRNRADDEGTIFRLTIPL